MDPQTVQIQLQEQCKQAYDHLLHELRWVHTGRASSEIVEDIQVDAYGSHMPIKGVASISIPESQTIQIEPWDKSLMKNIETAIYESPISLTPQNDGQRILINMPPLTEERRKEYVKLCGKYLENARISIRNARQKAMDTLKLMEKNKEISEDELKTEENKVQETIDKQNKQFEEDYETKEKDIMSV